MTASEASVVGIAKQTAKGTPNVTDADFKYFLFNPGAGSPQNLFLPLDIEVGGGALLRSVIKAGVMSGGTYALIPRPTVLGHFLMGALGQDTVGGANPGGSYTHSFKLPTNQFSAPYYTLRSSPGGMWGEYYQDCRLGALAWTWRAADFCRGSVTYVGGKPTPNVNMGTWAPATYLDGGPQFLAPIATIEVPDGTAIKVLEGSFVATMNIPMEEQWVTGSYFPDDFDINQRSFILSLTCKIIDSTLYNKMNYDPANGNAWLAQIFREANLQLDFSSDQNAGTNEPYKLEILANEQTGQNANVLWSCAPISLRGGRQVVATITGTFVASPTADAPIEIKLTNTRATAY